MSRNVPYDKPLSRDDRAYLLSRGRADTVAMLDSRHEVDADPQEDREAVAETVNNDPDATGTPAVNPVAATGEPVAGPTRPVVGDDYDTDAWSYRDLQEEAGNRGLPKSGSREEIVARLREWDRDNPQ